VIKRLFRLFNPKQANHTYVRDKWQADAVAAQVLATTIAEAIKLCSDLQFAALGIGDPAQAGFETLGKASQDNVPLRISNLADLRHGVPRFHRWDYPDAEIWLIFTPPSFCRIVALRAPLINAGIAVLDDCLCRDGWQRTDLVHKAPWASFAANYLKELTHDTEQRFVLTVQLVREAQADDVHLVASML
jgi:hypothetical protein